MKFTGWNKCMGDNINGWAKLSLSKLLDSSFVSSPTMGSRCDQAKMCWGFNGRPHCLLITHKKGDRVLLCVFQLKPNYRANS